MATTASSGGVTTQGSRTYLFGTSSGIDTSALVEVAYNQRISEATKIDTKISDNGKKIDAYTTLSTLTKSVQTSLANLSTSFGFSNTNPNYVFDARAGSMSTNNSTDPTKLIGVTIDPGTTLGSYKIEVTQTAKANRIASDSTSDATTGLGSSGSFNIGLGGGTNVAVSVTTGMSMTDIATAINATTATSGVSASILKTSSNSYQMILSGNQTNKFIDISNISGTNVLQNIGVTNGGTAKNTLQSATPAILKLDGVQVARDTNDVSDLIAGVHISVLNAEAGTSITLGIQNDTSQLKGDIEAFATAYNSLRDFILTNQAVGEGGGVSDDAVLFGDNILKMVTENIQPLIAQSYKNGANTLTTLGELGITLDPSNKLVIDDTKLDTAILNNYSDVKSIFATATTSDNTNFALLGNTSRQKNLSFAMNITATSSGVTSVSVGGNTNLFTVSGNSIVGKAGTIYEGLSFAYIGSTNATVNFGMNQGVGNLINNAMNVFTDPVTGMIQDQQTTLSAQNTSMSTRATEIRSRADDYRNKLIDKYAQYEASIARSKSIIAQLKAILGTTDN